jgi:hypothetical protein
MITPELATHLKMFKPFNNNTQLEVAYNTLNLLPLKYAGQCVGVNFRFSELTL